MEQIRKLFRNNFVDLSQHDWANAAKRFKLARFPKKTLLLKKGQTENYLSFVEKGIVRYYIPNQKDEVTLEFSFENEFIGAYDSFLSRLPSAYHVETVTPTILWRLTYDDLQQLYQETTSGNLIGRLASESLFLEKFRRELSFLHQTAEQRYLNLLTEKPQLVKEIPLHYIASYIGITPQALSRIRRRIS